MKAFNKGIKTLSDVKEYADFLHNECKVAFHPDDDFNEYICFSTGGPSFSKREAEINNRMMKE